MDKLIERPHYLNQLIEIKMLIWLRWLQVFVAAANRL